MLRFFAAFAFLLLALLALPAAAQPESECDADFTPFVNVTPVFDSPNYNFTTGLDGIQKIAQDSGHSIHEKIALGVTHYQTMLEFRTPVVILTYPDGNSCARVQRIDVTIGYKDVTVYVAREIPEGSCGFDEVMAHEQKHIDVNRGVLQDYAPRIQESVEDYLRGNAVIHGQDHDAEIARLRQNLQNLLDDLSTKMMNDNIARQKEVDSPEEYARLSHVCGGQLAAVAGRSLGAYR